MDRCLTPSSLAEHYPDFEARMRVAVQRIIGANAERRIEIGLAKDGSGVGGE